jgi:NAD(P)-dependent dehydrogenase (short-subunit alcohol dehydrogenase family)
MSVAVITGASHGLGTNLVVEFAGAGWRTIGVAQSKPSDGYPGGAEYDPRDVSKYESCQEFWRQVELRHAPLHEAKVCLVNCAGSYLRGGFLSHEPAAFEEAMRANYLTAVYMTRAMFDHVQRGTVVNVISTSALQAKSTNSAYGSAKAAMAQFFRSLQQEYDPAQYRITNLYPGNLGSPSDDSGSYIDRADLSRLIREIAESDSSFYVADMTLLPSS